MRYLVTAKIRPGQELALSRAVQQRTLGAGSVAGEEYLRNMSQARRLEDGHVRWVEVCFCPTPLEEERPYWEAYFDLVRVQDAHDHRRCRDLDGSEPWACADCDCSRRLEARLSVSGEPFLKSLCRDVAAGGCATQDDALSATRSVSKMGREMGNE